MSLEITYIPFKPRYEGIVSDEERDNLSYHLTGAIEVDGEPSTPEERKAVWGKNPEGQ